MKQNLLVVDGMNFLHRGFWAVNAKLTNKDGNPTNAIRGFVSILLADLQFIEATHCAVVFDRPGKNFRHKLYSEYKATRPKEDEHGIKAQIPALKKLLNAMGIKVYGLKGHEGDDLIGSIAVNIYEKSKKAKIYIASNDKDFASLVNNRIHLLKPQKVVLDKDGVLEHYGVPPNKMVEYLMMLGDKVDNIPGINKVGHKTAAKILTEYKSLDHWIKTGKRSESMERNLSEVVDFFPTSRRLITLRTGYFPDLTLDKLVIKPYTEELERICNDLDFKTTYKQIRTMLNNL